MSEPTEAEHSSLHQELSETVRTWRTSLLRWFIAAIVVIFLVTLTYRSFATPPPRSDFPKLISIPAGSTVRDAARILLREGAIFVPLLFKDYVILLEGEKGLQAGDYLFEAPESAYTAARHLTSGENRLAQVRITVPEGTSNTELAKLLENKLYHFDTAAFLKSATAEEGYLFPDTYLFAPTASPEEIIRTMKNNFTKKFETISAEVKQSNKPLADVITMASILEEEARTSESRKAVAGILWKRITIGMPLQVDAVFPYIIGKNTYELSLDDLKTDSPYNTYRYKGLPPGPITNPGLDAILAAATPTASPYLYYLTDSSGKMRYARTHEEHVENKRLYLR